jgi:predicted phage-related endonuclease
MSVLILLEQDPGSEEWLKARLGVITASEAHALMPDKKTGKPKTAARKTYMNKLIGEVCTGHSEEIYAPSLEWGRSNEEAALAAFEFLSGKQIKKTSLTYKDASKRSAATPDALIVGEKGGVESKSPITPQVHIDFVLNGNIKDEYLAQCHFSIWNFDYDFWIFNSYHPRMKARMSHFVTIERNPELIEFFDNEIPAFIKEMDKELEKIGIPWGAQWL